MWWSTTDGTTELPEAWSSEVVDGLLDLELVMTEGPDPTMTATAGGLDVLYKPSAETNQFCP